MHLATGLFTVKTINNSTALELLESVPEILKKTSFMRKHFEIKIGAEARTIFKTLQEVEKNAFINGYRKTLINTITAFSDKIKVDNLFIHGKCLGFNEPFSFDKEGSFTKLAMLLHLPSESIDAITNEYATFCKDPGVEKIRNISTKEKHRIDKFWVNVKALKSSEGETKYPHLFELAIQACILSPSNAQNERGFSENKTLSKKDRFSLKQDTLIAERLVKDTLRVKYDNDVRNVPLTNTLAIAVSSARSRYGQALDDQRRLEESYARERKRKAELEGHKLEEERRRDFKVKETAMEEKLVDCRIAIDRNYTELDQLTNEMVKCTIDRLISIRKEVSNIQVKIAELRKYENSIKKDLDEHKRSSQFAKKQRL
jgi:hypothetical protein